MLKNKQGKVKRFILLTGSPCFPGSPIFPEFPEMPSAPWYPCLPFGPGSPGRPLVMKNYVNYREMMYKCSNDKTFIFGRGMFTFLILRLGINFPVS